MKAILFWITLLYTAITVVCTAGSCPCYIPCTGKPEVCTCFGPRGDDGYGCKSNGEDYEFLSQSETAEAEWTVQCTRKSTCSKRSLLDDSNPFAAYELRDSNVLQSFDDDGDFSASTVADTHSSKWFGGNWFDFWGKNGDQFFIHDDDGGTVANAMAMDGDNINAKMRSDFDNVAMDHNQQSVFTVADSHSTSRGLKHSESDGIDLEDFGINEAGYRIVAIPLYALIICICGATIVGMLMCAGFVYCGLNCCCPLPPSSPHVSSRQKSRSMEMSRMLQSLTLGGGRRHKGSDSHYGVYHRMRNALHNPSHNEDNTSIASMSANEDDHDDEYVDSEDNQSRYINNEPTKGDLSDDLEEEERYLGDHGGGRIRRVPMVVDPFYNRVRCDSDIDQSSDEEEMMDAVGHLVVEQDISIIDAIEDHQENDGDRKMQEEQDDDDDDDDMEIEIDGDRKMDEQEGNMGMVEHCGNGVMMEEEEPLIADVDVNVIGNGVHHEHMDDPYGLGNVQPDLEDPDIVSSNEGTPLIRNEVENHQNGDMV